MHQCTALTPPLSGHMILKLFIQNYERLHRFKENDFCFHSILAQFGFIRNPVNFSIMGFLIFLLIQPVFASYPPKFPWSLFLKLSPTIVIPGRNLTNFEFISQYKNYIQQSLRKLKVKT